MRISKTFIALMALASVLTTCVEGPDEAEFKPLAFFEAAGGQIFLVSTTGGRSPLDYKRLSGMETANYLEIFLPTIGNDIITLTNDGRITEIDLDSGVEKAKFLDEEYKLGQLSMPGGQGIIKARLAWADWRLYVLTDTDARGVVLEEATLIDPDDPALLGDTVLIGNTVIFQPPLIGNEVGDTVLLGPLDNLGPGLENPVSFDLAPGANQIYVLYDSGHLAAYNLFMDDESEGILADFGPGARDLHVMPTGEVFIGASDGLYRMSPGLTVEQIIDNTDIRLVRVRNPGITDLFFTTAGRQVCGYNLLNGLVFHYLIDPELVTSLMPLDYHWVKNTRPVIEEPVSNSQRLTTLPITYSLSFIDPDQDPATVTVTLEADTVQNVFFFDTLTGTTTFDIFPEPGDTNSVVFYAGDTPGNVTIRVEAVSSDGQASRWEDQIFIQDIGIGAPPIILPPQSDPPYLISIDNQYLVSFFDFEGDPADVTVTLAASTTQGVYFTSLGPGNTVITFLGANPGVDLDVSFYGGDIPGPVTIRIEAVSSFGFQTDTLVQTITVQEPMQPPIILDPITTPPYLTLLPNPYLVYFADVDGDPADVKVTLFANPFQDVYFVGNLDQATVITWFNEEPSTPTDPNFMNASFFGGFAPGLVTIRIEVTSIDGQKAIRQDTINVQDIGITPP